MHLKGGIRTKAQIMSAETRYEGLRVNWYLSVFELIDMRSFSNLWFWISLAVVWSSASHWILGVPYDMVLRAKRNGDQAMVDLEDMVRINSRRLLYIARVSGLWILGIGFFILSSLAILGFYYWIEFAQAVFLLAFPMSGVGLLSLSTARLIADVKPTGEELCQRLHRHRIWTQVIGMVSVFVTSLWGMYQNVSVGVLG
jgi:hypothetical protein